MTITEAARKIRDNLRAMGESTKGRVRVEHRHFGSFLHVDVDGLEEYDTLEGVNDSGQDFQIEVTGTPAYAGKIGIDF